MNSSLPTAPQAASTKSPPAPLGHAPEPGEEELPEMGLMDHLRELRKRIVLSSIAITCAAVVGYLYAQYIFDILNKPYFDAFKDDKLIGTGPAEAFILKMKVAFFGGFILASPYVFYQLWLFIAPGLYSHEKRQAVPFIAASTLLFALGIWFGYDIIFPFAFQFFHSEYVSVGLTPTVRMSEHLSTMITGLLAFGVVFEMPVLAYFLARLGFLTDRFLIDHVRHAIVGIFILAAVLSPPDVITQCLLAAPLLVLYGLSILVVRWAQPKENPVNQTP
jgi:sec-independent protein translocase protein TatC